MSSEENEIKNDVNDGSKRYKFGFKIYKLFNRIMYKGTIDVYNENSKLYNIKYDDSDAEKFITSKFMRKRIQ